MTKLLDVVLLLALPASGKSEVRKYLAQLSQQACAEDFHMGPTVQLDDFPYVHVMRRIDEELEKRKHPRQFFFANDKSFINPKDWGTLIALLNEDFSDLIKKKTHDPRSAARHLFDRLDAASKSVGAPARLEKLGSDALNVIGDALEKEFRDLVAEKNCNAQVDLAGKTIVMEFARGGKHGSSMPLESPYGYMYSLGQLSPEILARARILYIWVTPEESRRKNHERTDPNDPGSILHHGVPIEVMMNEYGCDDIEWLERNSKVPGTVTIQSQGKTFQLPLARFDNRIDKTSFIRKDRKDWAPTEVSALHDGLRAALTQLAKFR